MKILLVLRKSLRLVMLVVLALFGLAILLGADGGFALAVFALFAVCVVGVRLVRGKPVFWWPRRRTEQADETRISSRTGAE